MAQEQIPGPSPGPSGDGQWLTIAAAARKLGVSPRAIRGKIKRGTVEWKPHGNSGKLVLVRPEDASPDDPGDDVLDELREELAEVRAQLLDARVGQARAEERATALRELVDREIARADRLEAELRRPWWARLLGR